MIFYCKRFGDKKMFVSGWMVIDYVCDFLYVIDIFIRMHEGKYLIIILNGYFGGHFEIFLWNIWSRVYL